MSQNQMKYISVQICLKIFCFTLQNCHMKILYLLVLLVSFAATRMFSFYQHTDPAAKCLDGTQAGFYYQKGLSNKVLIYFQKGGQCVGLTEEDTLKDCYQRSFTDLGSSAKYPKQRSFDNQSYLSTSHRNLFRHWTRIYIPYCDRSVHQGSRKEPIKYNRKNLYFRGANITIAHFNILDKMFGIFSVKHLIVSGTSAGGIASFAWSNYIYERAKHPKGVLIVVDSATFILDFKNAYGLTFIDFTRDLVKIINSQVKMPLTDCVKHYGSADQILCFQVGNAIRFIKPKVFFLQSQYDSYGIKMILLLKCVPQKNPASLQTCSASEIASIEQYRTKINEAMANVTTYKKNGVWSISCSQHGFLEGMASFDSPLYRIPTTVGTEITEALLRFMHSNKGVYIDKVDWPHNLGCNALTKPIKPFYTVKTVAHQEAETIIQLRNQRHYFVTGP